VDSYIHVYQPVTFFIITSTKYVSKAQIYAYTHFSQDLVDTSKYGLQAVITRYCLLLQHLLCVVRSPPRHRTSQMFILVLCNGNTVKSQHGIFFHLLALVTVSMLQFGTKSLTLQQKHGISL